MRRLCLALIFPILALADFYEDLESGIAEGNKLRIYDDAWEHFSSPGTPSQYVYTTRITYVTPFKQTGTVRVPSLFKFPAAGYESHTR